MKDDEINEKIHVEIMGLCVHEPTELTIGMLQCLTCNSILEDSDMDEIPDYCKNIEDAFLVVEKLEADGWIWTFSKNTNTVAAKYDARFFLMNERGYAPEKKTIAIQETLPLAICLAALDTVSSNN